MTITNALHAEWLKLKNVKIVWITFLAFSLAPLMGGVFMLLMKDPAALANSGTLGTKAQVMNFAADWYSYLNILSQAIGVGGILLFGFVASWIFGREYSDETAKDLLSLPVSRTSILNAKFIIYFFWSFALAVSNLIIGFVIGLLVQLPAPTSELISDQLIQYFFTTLLTIVPGTVIALMAVWGKGYLAPLGFVALTLVLAQVIAATGYGFYFPWSIPGLYSGVSEVYKLQLNIFSYLILIATGFAGYLATIYYLNNYDQVK
jgi:ABC-2 type transport system permease protein